MSIHITDMRNITELERLFNKASLVTYSLGGLLPGGEMVIQTNIREVLEVGCGAGGWTTEMAQTYYTQIHVTGVDSSPSALAYATEVAHARKLDNTHYYHIENLSGPFPDFPDAYFDLISAQFLFKSLSLEQWPLFLQECRRMLKPNGYLRVTDIEIGFSNGTAYEELIDLFLTVMHEQGRSRSKRHLGVLCEIEPLLKSAGYHTWSVSHFINQSMGFPFHDAWTRDYLIFSNQLLPFILQFGNVSKEYLEMLYRQLQREVNDPSFHAILPFLTVWGKK